jgi:hypothetical protein
MSRKHGGLETHKNLEIKWPIRSLKLGKFQNFNQGL